MTKFTSSQLRALRNASKGVTRVTEQLEELVYEVAYQIVEISPEEGLNIIHLKDRNLVVTKLYPTNQKGSFFYYLVDSTNTVFDNRWGYSDSFWAAEQLNDTGYFEDPEEYHKPTKESIKWFVENLGEILDGFIKLWNEETKSKEALINSLKEIVNAL